MLSIIKWFAFMDISTHIFPV